MLDALERPANIRTRGAPERPLPDILEDDVPDKATYWDGWDSAEPDGVDEGS